MTATPDDPDTLRLRTLDLLGHLADAARTSDIPWPDALPRCGERLADNRFTVLVAGEAKRGKSTFINALLGRPLLPTDVDVATCQVFRIQHADEDTFRLRFEDDTTRSIGPDELARHGSQAFVNAHDPSPRNQLLRWIEVETTAHFLPPNLTLLDTPGLGTLHADHARITERFVPEADAVLFVLHSDSPLGREEIRFLERLLEVTGDIFFVQTTIDRYSRSHWQGVLQRNQQILRERLGSRLNDKIWPVSSANLLHAAQSGDADFEQVSRYRPLRQALEAFLFRVAGCRRTAEALLLMSATIEQGQHTLANRLALLTGSTDAQRRLQALQDQHVDFARRWQEPGSERTLLLSRLTQAARDAQHEFWHAWQPGCPLELELRQQINTLASLEGVGPLAGELASRVAEAASRSWRQVQTRFQSRATSLLQTLARSGWTGDISADSLNSASSLDDLLLRSATDPNVSADAYWQMSVATEEFVQGAAMVGAAGMVLSWVVVTSWFPPLALAGALAAGVWGAVRGWSLGAATQLHQAQETLHSHLDNLLAQVRAYFLLASTEGVSSRVQHHFDTQVRELADRVDDFVRTRLEQWSSESARLMETARLDEQHRAAAVLQLQRQQAQWTDLATQVQSLRESLQSVSARWNTPPTSPPHLEKQS